MPTPPRSDFPTLRRTHSNYDPVERAFFHNLRHRYNVAKEAAWLGPLYTKEEITEAFLFGTTVVNKHIARVARWHVDAAESFLRTRLLDPAPASPVWEIPGLAADLKEALETNGQVLERPNDRETKHLPVLLIDEGTAEVGKIMVERVPNGSGRLYMSLGQAFVYTDPAWEKAQHNVRQALLKYRLWSKDSRDDLRVRIVSKDIPSVLKGGSAGALLGIAGAYLFDESGRWSMHDLLNEVAITACLTPGGAMVPATKEAEKIKAALEQVVSSEVVHVISRIVIAKKALIRAKSPILSHLRAPHQKSAGAKNVIEFQNGAQVIGANNLKEAVDILREGASQRFWQKFTRPHHTFDSLFENYHRLYQYENPGSKDKPLDVPEWLRSRGEGAAFLEHVWKPSEDEESREFVALLPQVLRELLQKKGTPQTGPKALSNRATRLLKEHLKEKLKVSPHQDLTFEKQHTRKMAVVEVKGVNFTVTVDRFPLDTAEGSQSLVLPRHTSGHLQKGAEFQKGLQKLLEEDLGHGSYYLWSVTTESEGPDTKLESGMWLPLADQIGETVIDCIKSLHDGRESETVSALAEISKRKDDVVRFLALNSKAVWRVPPPVEDYIPRRGDIATLEERLLSTRFATCIYPSLEGGGGLGKTQLVRAFAYDLLDNWVNGTFKTCEFPDGAIEINLRAYNYGPSDTAGGIVPHLSTAAALDAILSFIVPDKALIERHRLAGTLAEFYQEELAKRSLLLILDNAMDFGQIKDLLPRAATEKGRSEGIGTRVVITSRLPLGKDVKGVRGYAMAPWDENSTGDYLVKRGVFENLSPDSDPGKALGADDFEKVRRLNDATGGVPLAIKIAASLTLTTNQRGKQTIFDLLFAKLEGELSGKDAVATILDLGVSLMEPGDRRLYELLGVFPVKFDAAAAASVWQRSSVQEASDYLEDFVRRGLLNREIELQLMKDTRTYPVISYRMHDLVRKHAYTRLLASDYGSERSRECSTRFSLHYIARQAFCNDLLHHSSSKFHGILGRDNVTIASALIEDDQFNFDLVFERAFDARKGVVKTAIVERPARLLSLNAAVATRSWDLLLGIEKRRTRIRAARRLAKRRIVDLLGPESPGWSLSCAQVEHANHLISLGLALRHRGRRRQAERYFRAALEVADRLNWIQGLACAWGNLGNILQEWATDEKGDVRRKRFLEDALDCHERAERYSLECNDERMRAIDLGNQAIVHMDLWANGYRGESTYFRAIELYEERIKIAAKEEINDQRGEANGWGNKASLQLQHARVTKDLQIRTTEGDNALAGYLIAIRLHTLGCNLRGVAANLCNLGRAYRILASLLPSRKIAYLNDAVEPITRSLQMFTDIGDSLGQRVSLANLLALYLVDGTEKRDPDLVSQRRQELQVLESKLKFDESKKLGGIALGDEPAGLRQLSDKYGKLTALEMTTLEAEADPVAEEMRRAYDFCADFLEQTLR
jgi:tetratricopeptide (TPR) repeat protein